MTRKISRRAFGLGVAGAAAATQLGLAAPALAQARTRVRFTLDVDFWGPQSNFLLGVERGFYAAEGLDVQVDGGAGSGQAVTRVAQNTYDIGFGDFGTMARFTATNPNTPVTSFFVLWDLLQHGIVFRKGTIANPKDIEGKTLAAPEPDAGRQMFPLFAKVAGIDPTKVTLRHIDFPLRETLVVRGEAQGATGFVSSVALNMVRAGVPLDQIGWISYASVGIDLFGSTIFARREWLQQNPQVAAGFARATARSMQEMIRDPRASIEAARRRQPLNDMAVELPRYQMVFEQSIATPTTRANGIGHVDPARLTRNIQQLCEVFNIAQVPAADLIYNGAFLPAADLRRLPA
ncbi:MAG: ABC transporter substrate-binding protein [Magnetospirillum sp.]|jgi:NitT/TauT family transport system substrate-binding protein|nr:ABC transporter substrate-binding protein [Magnetospirillum sp.]